MNRVGVEDFLASVHAARMMVERRSGLIVNVSSFGSCGYLFDIAYGTGKTALDRLTADMARELRPYGVAVVSLWPGFVWTETTLPLRSQATPGYRRTLEAYGESPIVSGHAVAALAQTSASCAVRPGARGRGDRPGTRFEKPEAGLRCPREA
jgi:dehydrogenase/reductase SDR family protein 1